MALENRKSVPRPILQRSKARPASRGSRGCRGSVWPLAPAWGPPGTADPLSPAPTSPHPNSSVPSPLEEDFRDPGWGCQTASDECFFNPSPADLDDYSYLRQGRNARAWQPVTSGRRPLLASLRGPAPAGAGKGGGRREAGGRKRGEERDRGGGERRRGRTRRGEEGGGDGGGERGYRTRSGTKRE